ncbi:MAG TPA: nitric oxide reductase transcriptional regulator NorR [Pseudomonas sp.]|nr:nitric oxide reductase transcriptional regulator NorR [Pseudomonas sp.]|tara:strand:- start:8318 stop:9865 length:1548 start_codon:yes stop_codon:yes gene_type:complete
MTTSSATEVFLAVSAELSRETPAHERFQRLLQGLRQVFPCDAAALLQLQESTLIPLAADGLSPDTLGRRFEVDEHPRFSRILLSHEPVRFAADSPLPDPYDGLINAPPEQLHVHDCLGIALHVDERPWGVLTLDALEPGSFDRIDAQELRAFVRLTEASIKISNLIARLQQRADQSQQMARALLDELGQQSLLGQSRAIQTLRSEIDTVAQSDLTVLITGETGVGKELVARQLHAASSRASAPLVYVNCAALPENLVESELFGHTRGAFSGAAQSRAGRFELAHGGTLFLDEVGELPLAVQAKLLRALQNGEIQRVGSDHPHHVDVRIIAATNRDLQQEVARGLFRADLYHRLSVYPIRVPSLRERGRDVLLLAGHFLEQNRRRLGLRGLRLEPAARELLVQYSWPGNVRELEHLIGRAALKAGASDEARRRVISIGPGLLDLGQQPVTSDTPILGASTLDARTPVSLNLRAATEAFQAQLIEQTLLRHGGNRAAAARELGLDRANFSRLLKRLG